MERDFDFVATGHYARIQNDKGEYILLKGSDPSKDQSYFLYLLDERKLSRILFPVGDLYKSQVKSIAEEYGLPAAKRPESMGICFIGEVDIKDFLSKRIKPVEGKLLHVDGSEIGVHAGAAFYTIGQRHGFKSSRYFPDPLYVVSKDIESNTVTVGTFEDAKSAEFCVSSLHWIGNPPKSVSVGCRIRHLGSIYGCRIMPEVGKYRVVLDTPAFGVAPGQSVVFYSGEQVLGGGTIEN
jgi:tRNA-specific 2-thiouridylase